MLKELCFHFSASDRWLGFRWVQAWISPASLMSAFSFMSCCLLVLTKTCFDNEFYLFRSVIGCPHCIYCIVRILITAFALHYCNYCFSSRLVVRSEQGEFLSGQWISTWSPRMPDQNSFVTEVLFPPIRNERTNERIISKKTENNRTPIRIRKGISKGAGESGRRNCIVYVVILLYWG